MKRLVILLLFTLLVSCGPSDDLMESFNTAKAIEAELSDKYGLSTRVGIARLNGHLSDVTVTVGHKNIGDLAVEEVFELAGPILTRHLGEEPELITIAIIFVNKP